MQWIYGEIFMEINRLSGYSDFLGIVEYPAVVFCEDGEVLSINNAAVKIVGSDVESIAMELDKFMVSDEFWPTLDDKKAIIWHRLGLIVDLSTSLNMVTRRRIWYCLSFDQTLR